MSAFRNVGWDKMDSILSSLDDEIRTKSAIRFFREINLSAIEDVRRQYQARQEPKPSYTAFVTKAIARALREYPEANRRVFWGLLGRRLIEFSGIHISIAVERETRSAGPETIYDADRLSIDEIHERPVTIAKKEATEEERWAVFEKWVRRLPRFVTRFIISYLPRMFPGIWLAWRGGATLITSPAKYGVDMISGFWHWPITFSFGYVKPRPMAVDGRVEIHTSTILGMVWDRRVMVGAPFARFFNRVAGLLENPQELLEASEGPAPDAQTDPD